MSSRLCGPDDAAASCDLGLERGVALEHGVPRRRPLAGTFFVRVTFRDCSRVGSWFLVAEVLRRSVLRTARSSWSPEAALPVRPGSDVASLPGRSTAPPAAADR